ncbi:SDR family NAD(P)-dependent oxidoreductase [Rhodococcus hoagii]|nr:SDR family NAD(P)-dependent oxidoreductase [Prescottella equi]
MPDAASAAPPRRPSPPWSGRRLADLDRGAVEHAAAGIGTAHVLDVRSRTAWDACVADVGAIDILVNNAGVMPVGGFLDEPDATGEMTIDVNVWGRSTGCGPWCRHDRARTRARRERRVARGKIAIPGLAVYNASKFAAVGLSATARLEFADHGVSVSTVLPSAVRTTLTSGIPLGKGLPTVDPEDIADAIVRTVRTRRAETPFRVTSRHSTSGSPWHRNGWCGGSAAPSAVSGH